MFLFFFYYYCFSWFQFREKWMCRVMISIFFYRLWLSKWLFWSYECTDELNLVEIQFWSCCFEAWLFHCNLIFSCAWFFCTFICTFSINFESCLIVLVAVAGWFFLELLPVMLTTDFAQLPQIFHAVICKHWFSVWIAILCLKNWIGNSKDATLRIIVIPFVGVSFFKFVVWYLVPCAC